MKRTGKESLVRDLSDVFACPGCVVALRFHKFSAVRMTNLRASLDAGGARIIVVKNTLARRALRMARALPDEAEAPGGEAMFAGSTALAWSNNPIAAPQVLRDFEDEEESLTVIGGWYGKAEINAQDIQALANTPPLDVSRAKFLGILTAPASRIARLAAEPASMLARLLSARA